MENNWTTTDWTVIAYVGPQLTAKNERMVHLYPEIPGGAKYHCADVYEERFDLLPYGLGDTLMEADIIPGRAPGMDEARVQGILKSCPPFMVETYVKEDGSKTKKIAFIGGPASKQAPAGSVPAGRAHESAVDGLEFQVVDEDSVSNQVGLIGLETNWKMQEAFTSYDHFISKYNVAENLQIPVFHAMWRDINDQYRVVRPVLLLAKEEVVPSAAVPDGSIILAGDRGSFLGDIAGQHPDIDTADDAKNIFELLDIKSSADEPEMRVLQAQQVWLCATLISNPYCLDRESAVAFSLSAIQTDEVPF